MTASEVSKVAEPTQMKLSFFQRSVVRFFKFVNSYISWHKLPKVIGTFVGSLPPHCANVIDANPSRICSHSAMSYELKISTTHTLL